jgi:hypothetical protein
VETQPALSKAGFFMLFSNLSLIKNPYLQVSAELQFINRAGNKTDARIVLQKKGADTNQNSSSVCFRGP